MARIAGVNIPVNKHINIALTYIYGIGRPLGKVILGKSNISLPKGEKWNILQRR